MDELDAMRTFVRVAEGGSFTAAARVLGTTQPSVSRRVAALEDALGATLLVRTTRRVTLTDAGRRYYEASLDALAALERARQAPGQAATTLRGLLRVTAPVSFSTAWLAPRLPGFTAAHPDIELLMSFSEQHADLVGEGFDLGIRVGGPERSDLVGRRVGRIRRHLVAAPPWVNQHGLPVGPDDLAGAAALAFTGDAGWSGWPVEVDGTPRVIRPGRVLRATSGDFLRVLVRSGEGIAALPDWLVADDLRDGRLVELLPGRVALPGLDLWLVWPAQHHLPATARRFVDWVTEEARSTWTG